MRNNSKYQIKLGAIMSYIGIIVKIIAGLVYTPWLVDKIGKSDYGLFSLSISIISMFAVDFGLGIAVARFLSKYKTDNDHKKADKFLGMAMLLYLFLALLLFLVLFVMYFFIGNIYTELTETEIARLKVIYIITGLFTSFSFIFKPFEGILIANERFVFIKVVDLMHKILTIFLMVIALLVGRGLYTLVLINAFVGVLMILAQYIYIVRTTDAKLKLCKAEKSMYIELFGFSFWATIAIMAHRFIINITPSILAATAGSIAVSIFAIGAVIEGYTFTIASAIGGLFLPKVTQLLAGENSKQKINELNIQVGRIQLMIVGMIIVVFLVMGKEFTKLWMGPDFNNSYYVACLLIFPYILVLTYQIANTVFMAKNQIKYIAISTLITAVLSIILSIILCRKYGAIGAGVAIFAGNVLGRIIIANIFYEKILKLNMLQFHLKCHLCMTVPLLFLAVFAMFMQIKYPTDSFFVFAAKIAIVVFGYCIVTWIIALNHKEKELLTSLLKHITDRIPYSKKTK